MVAIIFLWFSLSESLTCTLFTLPNSISGSERQKATDTAGDRLKEASMINNSLLCLGQVINSLVDREKGKEKHVPFRDSKLTFLLRDSWGGNSKTCLVATVTPSIESLTETISTLKFAQRAKLIKNTAVLNEDTCGSVVALKAEIARLSSELQQRNASAYAAGSNRHSLPSPGFPPLAPRQQGKSNNAPSNDVTITALRNQNSKLSKKMNHLEETTTQREIQVNSLKRKLQQETLIRKCKERRIAYLTDKNKSADAIESEEIVALREEVLLLREQLEGHSTESIEWMLKYKEEKARVEEMENDVANNTMAPNEQDELEVSLVSLLDERDLLKQQVETMNSQRNTEIDSIMTDVTKIETENANLKSALDNKNMEVLQHEETIRSSEIQLESLQDEVKKAIDCLELAQNDLATEKGKSEALQSSIDSMKKEVKEELQKHKDAHDVATATLNAKISELEAEFIAAMDDNDSLMKKMKDVSDKLESKQVQLDTLQREKDDAMQLLEERGEKESADLEARSAQEQQLRDEIKQLEDTVVTLLREKTEATDSLEKTNLENTALLEVLDSLKVQNAKLQKQVVAVSALEDEVTFVTDEKENVELYLAFAQADLNRSLRLQQNAISNDIAAFDIELALRDETINSIAHEKANLEHELSNVSAQLKELKQSSQEKEAMLQDELAYTKEECESMKHQMEGVKSELDTTKSHYAKSVAYIGDRDKKTADKITELQSEKDAVDKELDETKLLLAESFTAKVELDNNNAKIADLESVIEQLRKENNDLKDELAAGEQVRAELDALKVEMTALEDECNGLKSDESSTKEEVVSLKEKLETLEKEYASLREEESESSDKFDVNGMTSPNQGAGSPAQNNSPSQEANTMFGADDSFDESMFLPNIKDEENTTPSKTPFKERRGLFSPPNKMPLKSTPLVKRTPLGKSAQQNTPASSTRKLRTNMTTPF